MYLWWSNQAQALTPLIVGFGVVVIAVPAYLHLAGATTIAWIVAPLGVAFAASGLVSFFLSRRAASRALGVKITSKNNPPKDHSGYLAWCQRNNLVPFAGRSRASI